MADSQDRTADELAAAALTRYLDSQQNVQALDELAAWGKQHAQVHGFQPSDVERAIAEVRRAR